MRFQCSNSKIELLLVATLQFLAALADTRSKALQQRTTAMDHAAADADDRLPMTAPTTSVLPSTTPPTTAAPSTGQTAAELLTAASSSSSAFLLSQGFLLNAFRKRDSPSAAPTLSFVTSASSSDALPSATSSTSLTYRDPRSSKSTTTHPIDVVLSDANEIDIDDDDDVDDSAAADYERAADVDARDVDGGNATISEKVVAAAAQKTRMQTERTFFFKDFSVASLYSTVASSLTLGRSRNSTLSTFLQIKSQKLNSAALSTAEAAAAWATTTSATLLNPDNNEKDANSGSSSSRISHSPKHNTKASRDKIHSKLILSKAQKTDAPMLNYIFDTFSTANKHHHHDQRHGPHFEDVQRVGQPTNVTVQAGGSVFLNCRISLLQDKTVSWVRRHAHGEDALDLLTVGLHTYTGDNRYTMQFQYPSNWRLKITNVRKDDEAMYECQISTHPPRVIQINLLVNAPKVMIVDEFGDPLQEKYYEIDSTLQLSCVVRNVAMTSAAVFWKHGEQVLNYDTTRGGVSVKTELMDDGANSTLFIAKISKSDSGNYTCSISDIPGFNVMVHILNGESFAELHHGAAAALATSDVIRALIAISLIMVFVLASHKHQLRS